MIPEFLEWKDEQCKKYASAILHYVVNHLDEYDQDYYPTLSDKVYAEALRAGWSRTHAKIIAERAMNLGGE